MDVSKLKAVLSEVIGSMKAREPHGILGPAEKARAAEHGVVLPVLNVPEGRAASAHGWLERLGILPETPSYEKALSSPKKNKVVVAPSAEPAEARRMGTSVPPVPKSTEGDKWEEVQLLKGKGFYPETERLGAMLSEGGGNLKDLTRALKARFGGRRWLIKGRDAAATAPEDLITEANLAGHAAEILKRPSEYMAQEMKDISVPPYQAALDRMAKNFLKSRGITKGTAIMRGTNEFRVHGMGGRVVPNATLHRGNLLKAVYNYLSPIRGRDMRAVEEYAQKVIDALPEGQRKGFYGMDIGVEARTGKPFLIETNPAGEGGISGMIHNWTVQDAIRSAIQGRVPAYVKARNLTYGAGLAGAGAYGLHAAAGGESPEAYTAGMKDRFNGLLNGYRA